MSMMDFEHTCGVDSDRSSVLTESKKSSMIYNVLPAIVQSRVPAIPSLRRALSDFRGRTVPDKNELEDSEPMPLTPPPGYTTWPGSASSSTTNSNRNSIAFSDGEVTIQEDACEHPESAYSTPPSFRVSETRTGVNWKYANQGISLSTQAYAESLTSARKDDETTTFLTRQLYIHGLTYLLRGLPSDLSPEETISLQAATPQRIAVIRTEPCNHTAVPLFPDFATTQSEKQDPSLLQRIIALIIVHTFVLIRFLLPYVKILISHAYRFERDHRVTQRLVNNGIMTAESLRRRSLQLSRTICQMNDGRVGKALNEVVLWWLAGLTGGLEQGIREGIVMMSKESSIDTKDRSDRVD